MSYTPIFTKPYADGYKNKPNRTTPVTAEIKNKETETLLAIEAYLAALQIPEKLSELTNDEGFIKNTVSNLANYYLKSETYARTETYTQAEVQALIAAAVSSVAGKLNMEVVDSLPVEGISTTTFYLLPKETAEEKNAYDEYINTDGTESGWELIGAVSTSVDLSEYYKKTEVDTLLAEKVNTSDLVASSFSGTKAIIGNQVSGGGGSALHVYSTEEKVVGTWINGKPVYQKTYIGVQINSSESVWVNNLDVTDLNIDNFLRVYGTLVYTDGKVLTLNGAYLQLAYDPSTKFIIATQKNLGSKLKWNVDFTIYYTKATDTATA